MILKLPKSTFNSVKIHRGVQAFNSSEVTSGITGVHRAYSWLLPKHPTILLTDTTPASKISSAGQIRNCLRFHAPCTFCWFSQASRALPQM